MKAAHHQPRQVRSVRKRALDAFGQTTCDLCGEFLGDPETAEVAEFWDPKLKQRVVVHGQCGLDAGLEMA